MDEQTWPDGFCDIGGKTFLWTWQNKSDWCKFTIDKMTNPSGLFLDWKNYLSLKLNNNPDGNRDDNNPATRYGDDHNSECSDERKTPHAQDDG